MIYVSVEVLVRRRPEVVWGFLTDVPGLPEWVEGLTSSSVSEGPAGVGMCVDLTFRASRRRYPATTEVTVWREPELLVLETRLPDLLVLDRAHLTPCDEGTALRVESELTSGGVVATLLARPTGLLGALREEPPIQRVYERSIEALVKRIEALTLTPYR